MHPLRSRSCALALCLALTACGEPNIDVDASARDASALDAAPHDAAVPVDARAASDAAPPLDAAPVDAGPPVDPLGGTLDVSRVDDGYEFLEGPQWLPSEGVLVFSDIPASTIYQLTPPSAIEVYAAPSGRSNGLAVDATGRILRAEHAGRRIARERSDRTWEPLATEWMGERLNSPNDLVLASDGTIYFTDPPYGLEGAPSDLSFMGIFRIEPSGTLHAEWEGPLAARPNGIALSPDQRLLYVADSQAGLVRALDVAADGSLSAPRIFTSETPGADGMAIDTAGNLYVTTRDGVAVLRPDASRWGTIDIPEQPANAAFGGADRRTLYVTARTGLYRVTGLAVDGTY